ncbi:inositol monophosphatase family protein [Streptosporangium saharense]|uniref:inositol monophosphatase family protein n=1 Tax=Streptosporangium saharense TaxID=1706840 RepID=UPI00332E9615
MSQPPLPALAHDLVRLVVTVMDEIRPRLLQAALSGERSESRNHRHADNFLSQHDLWMHERYRELLSEIIPSYVYASEEADPQIIGDDPDPDLCVLVDPLDTSELAVRALYGYTHVLVYSRRLARPIAAVVGDIFHHVQIYLAARDTTGGERAFALTRDGTTHPLRLTRTVPLSQALVTNYLMKPAERFHPLTQQTHLLQELGRPSPQGGRRGRLGVDFGSVGLCHIAAGFTDAMIEFAKGFAIWDLAPGHYILTAANGVVLDLQGRPIPLDYRFDTVTDIGTAMNQRRTFIAASSLPLAETILHTLQKT